MVPMTKNQKEAVYTLLKTASGCYLGYTDAAFEGAPPAFEDDAAPPEGKNGGTDSSRPLSSADEDPSLLRDKAAEADVLLSPSLDESGKSPSPLSSDTIIRKVLTCTSCVLSRYRKNAVIGEGVRNPAVLVVGEGPGEEEDRSGRPFVGPAGQLLDKMLSAISLSRTSNCYIANIVKCRPPMNRAPMSDEINACMGFLQAQILLLRPKAILSVGRTSIQALLGTTQGIGALRGRWFEYGSRTASLRIPVMATYHPSALLRDAALKRPAWEDLKAFKKGLLERVPDYAERFYDEASLH